MSGNAATKYDLSDDLSEIRQALWRQRQHGDVSANLAALRSRETLKYVLSLSQ